MGWSKDDRQIIFSIAGDCVLMGRIAHQDFMKIKSGKDEIQGALYPLALKFPQHFFNPRIKGERTKISFDNKPDL